MRLVGLTGPNRDQSCAANTGATGTLDHRHVCDVPKSGPLRACAKVSEYSIGGEQTLTATR